MVVGVSATIVLGDVIPYEKPPRLEPIKDIDELLLYVSVLFASIIINGIPVKFLT